jgi:hypothetical protein
MGDLHTPFSLTDQSPRQKVKKETSELNYSTDQINLTDICKVFHPTAMEYTFFSASCRTLSKIGHILAHKTSLKEYKRN